MRATGIMSCWRASILQSSHPVFTGIEGPLPPILGMNKTDFRRDGQAR